MPVPLKARILVVAVLAIAGMSYGLVRLLTSDNREEIAMAMLFHDEQLDMTAINGAISARFLNEPAETLTNFVKSIGGTCGMSKLSPGTIECSFPVRGVFCVAQNIQLIGDVADDKIQKIRAIPYYPSC